MKPKGLVAKLIEAPVKVYVQNQEMMEAARERIHNGLLNVSSEFSGPLGEMHSVVYPGGWVRPVSIAVRDFVRGKRVSQLEVLVNSGKEIAIGTSTLAFASALGLVLALPYFSHSFLNQVRNYIGKYF